MARRRPDGVPAEILKVDMTSTVNILHSLFKKIWDKAEVSCYCQFLEKVFCRILVDRMKTAVDAKLLDQQAGFR